MPDAVPLVLLPALLCDAALFGDMLAYLGPGVSPLVLISSHARLADSVADILARAPPHFVLAGTSYGASLAIAVALAAPDRVTGLWLMGIDPSGPDREQILAFATLVENSTDTAIGYLAVAVVHVLAAAASEAFRAMATRVGGAVGGAQMRALAARESLWDKLPALTMPTLVLWGAEDSLVRVSVGRALAAALPNAQFHALPACGHLPTLEQPRAVAAIAHAWLSEHWLPEHWLSEHRGPQPTG